MTDFMMIFLSILFGLSILYIIVFHFREGRDERGQFILTRIYSLAYGMMALGLVALLCFFNWSKPTIWMDLTIKDALFLLLCLSGIASGVALAIAKRKY
jgi:FtsH-binding integral membrane protein